MLGDVERKGGLAHGRSGGDDDHLALLEAVGRLIEIEKAGLYAGDELAVLRFESAVGFLQKPFEVAGFVFAAGVAQLEDLLLGFFQQILHGVAGVVAVVQDVAGRIDQVAQHRLVAHDLGVIGGAGGTGHGLGQLHEIIDAADLFELLLVLEALIELDHVDRLLMVVQLDERFVDGGMGRPIEVIRAFEDLDHITTDPPIEDHRPQQGGLSLGGVRGKLVEKLGQLALAGIEIGALLAGSRRGALLMVSHHNRSGRC